MNYKNAYIVIENGNKKEEYPAYVTVGVDGRIIAETFNSLPIEALRSEEVSYLESPCIFALKTDVENLLNLISEAQDRGDLDSFNDSFSVGLSYLRLQDMLDGILYPILIDKLRHNYPIYIKELNKKIKDTENGIIDMIKEEPEKITE